MIHVSRPWIGEEERAAVARVLDSGVLVQGPETRALEEEWARACDASFAVATSSGTTALMLALLAHGVGPGDEVVTTPFTFVATVNAILQTGATPVFVDIDEDTFNLDVTQLPAALSKRTKAILPVHLFGQPCELDEVASFAAAHGLTVIEDAAQAMGATFRDRKIGSAHTTCFSLYATKNVMAGEGGMITTNDVEVARRCRMLRSHGREGREEPREVGFNARMSELHAALGRASLTRLGESTQARTKHASQLSLLLSSAAAPSADERMARLSLPGVREGRTHVWHQYTVSLRTKVEDGAGRALARDAIIGDLRAAGVGAGVFYRTPAHTFPFVRERGARVGAPSSGSPGVLPVAERLANSVFSLPVHPLLSDEDLEVVTREVLRAVRAST